MALRKFLSSWATTTQNPLFSRIRGEAASTLKNLRPSSRRIIQEAPEFGFQVKPLHQTFAAEVLNVSQLGGVGKLPEQHFNFLKRAFEEFSVLVIRDQQNLKPKDLVDYSARFGPLEVHVLKQFTQEEHPEIYLISNEEDENGKPLGLKDAGRYWHTDLSYLALPSYASFLHAQKLPQAEHEGDTVFVSMHEVYDRLPKEIKSLISGLEAEHSYEYRMQASKRGQKLGVYLDSDQKNLVPPVVHPVVRIHEATGRPALFVNEGFTTRILDVPEKLSSELLKILFDASTKGISLETIDTSEGTKNPIVYRHRWKQGDLVMWDNTALIHHATPLTPGQIRTMHRTTITGIKPIPYQNI